MAQLNSSVVQGSLRVTDTTYTTNANISSLTASQAVITDANKNLISRNIYNKTTVGNLEWTSAANDIHLVTKNTLAYWNGLYNASSSNLTYCNKGAFGDMAIKTKGNGFSDSSNTISVAYGTGANTALQGNQILFKLNNTDKTAASPASFYAPTTGGTKYQILISDGTAAPVWTAAATLDSATNATSGTAAYTNLTLGNNVNVSSATAHSEGKITLYSAATNAHIIQGQSTTDDFTHTLPNDTGVLVSLHSGTAKGSATKPVYVPNTGIITECNDYAGGTAVTLNGTNKSADTASFYAPTTYGTAGYILKANGEGEAPFWVEKVSYNNLPTNDNFILTEGSTSTNPPATAQATIPSNYALNKKIYYSSTQPTGDNAIQGMFWFKPADVTIEDLKCLPLHIQVTSTSTSQTFYNQNITEDMVVIKCDVLTPSAQSGDITWTTHNGNINLAGTFSTSTYIDLYLMRANQEDQ